MRPAYLLWLALLFPLAGCSSNNQGKLEGTRWRSDADSFKGKKFPAGYLVIHFKVDGSLIFKAGDQVITGKYTYGWGDNVTLHLDRELGGLRSHTEKVIVHGDRMSMSDSDGTNMRFQKE